MSRPATTPAADRLLHCSPERTLFVTTDPTSGAPVVCKVLVRGSFRDAEREVALGRQGASLDVVQYLRAAVDPVTNRPCVLMTLHDGIDLDRLVGSQGALPAARACALLAPVARTLAAMHALRTPDAPHGLCHGDCKPANLLLTDATTLLLDFEHACPIAVTSRSGSHFTGGTFGFAPPEAETGALPTAAFDVFGLGATLRFLLTGGDACVLPQHDEVRDLVQACTALDPQRRPSAADVAIALEDLAARLADDDAELVLQQLTSGALDEAARSVALLPAGPRHTALLMLVARRQRLLARVGHVLRIPDAVPTAPRALHGAMIQAQRVLRRFPRHTGVLRWRAALCTATGHLLASAGPHTSALRREEQFEAASTWLADVIGAAGAALATPGRCPIPFRDDPRAVGLLHRDPLGFLRQQLQEVAEVRRELETDTLAITQAEERLDLVAAELAIDKMAVHYGGTSPTAARRRDQLHRLAFYLDRCARAQPNIERVIQLWDGHALQPLVAFATACTQTTLRAPRGDSSTGPVGLRSLQVTLVNLVEEFPHLYAQAGPALEALSSALGYTTDQSWLLLDEAQQLLKSVPVPVRPLQTNLARLDTLRILEALVDRPERPRSQLQDGIESLRLVLEQARATRDRLAHGAEQAMARGHWTTGLFDMERAVGALNPSDEGERGEAQRLRDRLAEARRRKQELEAAVRRNVELESQYAMLQDDATSSFRARLTVLGERRDCLHFLAMHLPADRGALYGRDLREVETRIALEEAGLAENELDGTEEPGARLRLARATLERVGATIAASDGGAEPPGRMLRLLDHWRTVTAQCQKEVERLHEERTVRARQRARLVAVAVAAVIVSVSAIGFAVRSWLWG